MSICGIEEKERIEKILELLAEYYPEAGSGLVYNDPYQLFVATVLSAQTTDEQVNRITGDLFKVAPTVDHLSRMKPSELEPYLKRVGLYRHKSRYLIEASRVIVEKYGSRIPGCFEELIKLPGVGRKTANIIISSAYGLPAIAVDTHVFRVTKRLQLAGGKNVDEVEEELKQVIPQGEWTISHHRLIAHGRQVCQARKPQCVSCFLKRLCPHARQKGEI